MIGMGIRYGPPVDTSIRIYDVKGRNEHTLIEEVYPSDMSRFFEDASVLARKYGIELTDEMQDYFFFTMGNNLQTCTSFKHAFEWHSWTCPRGSEGHRSPPEFAQDVLDDLADWKSGNRLERRRRP